MIQGDPLLEDVYECAACSECWSWVRSSGNHEGEPCPAGCGGAVEFIGRREDLQR